MNRLLTRRRTLLRIILTVLAVTLFAADAQSGPLRNRRSSTRHTASSYTVSDASGTRTWASESTTTRGPAVDALSEVNAARARRGLPPYLRDPALTQAAQSAATYRARYRIAGHVSGGMGDFQFLPPGSTAGAAGCAALDPSWGFQACCQWERWTYAGAATVRGSDGRLYHHLFVK